jgi:hypothetical protein
MRGLKLIVAAGAFALLPACNMLGLGSSGASDSGAGSNVAAKADDAPAEKGNSQRSTRDEEPARNESRSDSAPVERVTSDQAWVHGRWGDAGCQTILEIQSDGSYLINGTPGQWTLDGATLTMSDGNDEQTFTVTRDSDGISIEDAQGNVQQLGRC